MNRSQKIINNRNRRRWKERICGICKWRRIKGSGLACIHCKWLYPKLKIEVEA